MFRTTCWSPVVGVIAVLGWCCLLGAAEARLPIREVTVFKDGHAFVLHEGSLDTNEIGNVEIDHLPAPVIGTFWPFASGDAKLRSVVASRRTIKTDRPARTMRELLTLNVGAEGVFTDSSGRTIHGTLLSILEKQAEPAAISGRDANLALAAQPDALCLIRTSEGTLSLPVSRLQDALFKGDVRSDLSEEKLDDVLTLRLDWQGKPAATTAQVGMMYLQKGLRWIPSYRVSVDGAGRARIELEATILNELEDLNDVTVNLVIGVPTIQFKDTLDPMALEGVLAELSSYFQSPARTAATFSNALMAQTQMARMGEHRGPRSSEGGADDGMPESSTNEDLYVFTVPHLTLKRNERMVLPIAEHTVDYKDVFTLDLSLTPPAEVRRNFGGGRDQELARLLEAPKVLHQLRLTNSSPHPFTTAPALILSGGRIVAQGMMTYTAAGATSDLPVTAAVDISVRKVDSEANRTPNAVAWNGSQLLKVDLAGKITLTSHRRSSVEIEVTRRVLGNVDVANAGGLVTRHSTFDDEDGFSGELPAWWSWYAWPAWWNRFNAVSKVKWTMQLEPGKSADLTYTWHYFWG